MRDINIQGSSFNEGKDGGKDGCGSERGELHIGGGKNKVRSLLGFFFLCPAFYTA